MSDRTVPYNKQAKCDGCGAVGAYDFMGDYVCSGCMDKEQPVSDYKDMCALVRDALAEAQANLVRTGPARVEALAVLMSAIEALEAERDDAKELEANLRGQIDELLDQLAPAAGYKRDAERYRFIRNMKGVPTPEDFDAAVDADAAPAKQETI